MKGVEQVNQLDENAVSKFKGAKKKDIPADQFLKEILSGNITYLGRAITLIESSKNEHRIKAQEIINKCMPHSGNSVRIGFTGVPGVGKSTFIEALGMNLINKGKKVAVLAIDPSSERSGGSILGDKTRMEQLSASKNAFIRPSPSAGSLGGVARKTAETIILCEAAGFNTIFVETVGVGQSEIAVHSMVDFFLLLMLAGAGDELQGIKRGIMEMADAIVINKAESDNISKANRAKAEYQNALHLFPPAESGWIPKVLTASALTGVGIEDVWNIITDYIEYTQGCNFFTKKRNEQSKFRMYEMINEEIKNRFYDNKDTKLNLKELEKKLLKGEISPYFAANMLLK
ncbi:MAG: methylmalonyl Co-A mutase-associated GTPase MeaB [Bacteroidales bacterium]|nr:methylmalonyl Co-A mutase-associated GTPase MeaB [Bacteroidales bacterium]